MRSCTEIMKEQTYSKEQIREKIIKLSKENDIDPALMLAICEHESNYDQYAKRYEVHVFENIRKSQGVSYTKRREQARIWARKRSISFMTECADQSFSYGLYQIMGFNLRKFNYPYNDMSLFMFDVDEQILFAIAFVQNIMKDEKEIKDILCIYNAGRKNHPQGKVYANNVYKKYENWTKEFKARERMGMNKPKRKRSKKAVDNG